MQLATALTIASGVAVALSIAGIAYLLVAIACTLAFARRLRSNQFERANGRIDSTAPARGATLPGITIFKPLSGSEPGLSENLTTFCEQDYPHFQVLFGVRDADDAAIEVVGRVVARHPGADLALIVDGGVDAPNRKIASVLNMFPRAKHDLLVVADSDMRVDANYLSRLASTFGDERVGAATCVYRGAPAGGLASELGSMFINEQFIPSVFVDVAFERTRFCLGGTMAVRRSVLRAIGGFEALAAYLADDQMLGKLVSDKGFEVAIVPYVLEHAVNEPGIGALWRHELRWARTIRAARPLGYAFWFITYALPLALIAALLSRSLVIAATLVTLALVLRIALHFAARSALQARPPATPWLVPARDLLGFAIWIASFFGRRVWWRNREISVGADGKIVSGAPTCGR